jgi:putative addiction module antidote
MIALKVTAIGNSVGVVLPKEALAKLRVGKGDTLYLTDSPDGLRITGQDPGFADQMKLAERIMAERRTVLRALSK